MLIIQSRVFHKSLVGALTMILQLFQQKSSGEFNDDGLLQLPDTVDKFKNKWEATKYLINEGILTVPTTCPKCSYRVGFQKNPYEQEILNKKDPSIKPPSVLKDCFLLRCKDRKCSCTISIFKDTMFAKNKKPVNEVLMCLHLWLAAGSHVPMMRALTGWT